MGNRIIQNFLLQHANISSAKSIESVHMVFPDMNIANFVLLEMQMCSVVKRCFVYTDDNDPYLIWSKRLSSRIERLGRPKDFFLQAERNGGSFVLPENRFFIDVSAMDLRHQIPLQLLAAIETNGLECDDGMYKICSIDDDYQHRQFKRCESLSKSLHTK
jgi:hypothetical protein